ncbi:hypothetical protein QEQ_3643 [Clostridioides difficile CD144]|nr:hypothetical protein QEQ_3643 [Clostridioides difficile CD144]
MFSIICIFPNMNVKKIAFGLENKNISKSNMIKVKDSRSCRIKWI